MPKFIEPGSIRDVMKIIIDIFYEILNAQTFDVSEKFGLQLSELSSMLRR